MCVCVYIYIYIYIYMYTYNYITIIHYSICYHTLLYHIVLYHSSIALYSIVYNRQARYEDDTDLFTCEAESAAVAGPNSWGGSKFS